MSPARALLVDAAPDARLVADVNATTGLVVLHGCRHAEPGAEPTPGPLEMDVHAMREIALRLAHGLTPLRVETVPGVHGPRVETVEPHRPRADNDE